MHFILCAINSSKDQDIAEYRIVARRVHKMWVDSLGQFRMMTASIHILLAHGHLFLDYAQNTLKCPNGHLSEASVEAANKLNRLLRFFLSRKNSLRNERVDMMIRHLWQSDPIVIAFAALQRWAKGRIGKGNKPKLPD